MMMMIIGMKKKEQEDEGKRRKGRKKKARRRGRRGEAKEEKLPCHALKWTITAALQGTDGTLVHSWYSVVYRPVGSRPELPHKQQDTPM